MTYLPPPPPQPPYMPPPPPLPPPRRRRFPLFWLAFTAVQVIFLVWVIGGANAAQDTGPDCGQACQAGTDAGTVIGVAVVVALWIGVDLLLLLGRVVVMLSRRRSR